MVNMNGEPVEPSRTEIFLARNLDSLGHDTPFMLRTSDDEGAPWRPVRQRRRAGWTDPDTGAFAETMTVNFWFDDSERVLNFDDPVEVGF